MIGIEIQCGEEIFYVRESVVPVCLNACNGYDFMRLQRQLF